MANEKLIKELMIKVTSKGLGPAAKHLESVADNLENAAAGAELLDSALKPIPESLKEIVKEAEDVEAVFANFGKKNEASKLDSNFEQLDETLNDLIGTVLGLQDAMTIGFGNSVNSADNNMKELIHSIERFEDSTGDASRSSQNFMSNLFGVGNASEKANRGLANTTRTGRGNARTFADIAKFAGPLPGLYAIIAANAFALSEAFRVLSEGDQINRLEKVGTVLGAKVGVPIQSIARAMEEATGYTVSYEEALRQASSASTYGFSSEQIVEMTKAARRASVALGVDMTDAMNRIIRGVSKLEIELLDELGITVRLTEAYETYAATIGKTANELTGYQKQQAYLNAVLKESKDRQGEVDALAQATGWERLGAAVGGATTRGKQWLAEFLEPAARQWTTLFEQSPGEKIVSSTQAVINTLEAAANSASRTPLILSVAGLDDNGLKVLQDRIALVQKSLNSLQKNREEANKLGRGVTGETAQESSLRRELVSLTKVYDDLKGKIDASKLALGSSNDVVINSKAEAVKAAQAWAKGREELTKIAADAKGTSEPFEILATSLRDFASIQNDVISSGEAMSVFWENVKITPENVQFFKDLQAGMERLYTSTAKLETLQLRTQESDRAKGIIQETTALKLLEQKIGLAREELKLSQLTQQSPAKQLVAQEQVNQLLVQRSGLLRAEQTALLENVQANDMLLLNQKLYTQEMSRTSTEFERQKELLVLQIQQNQQSLSLAEQQNVPIKDQIALKQQLLDLNKKSIELDRQELNRRFSEQSDALGTGNKVLNVGPLEALRKEVALAEQQTKTAAESGAAQYEVLLEKLKRELELKAELARAEEDEVARLNNLFLTRTGQQDLLNMNMEQQLAYQQEIGASMYESARSALDAFDPAMGAMFDGLQKFTVALVQMGDTSQGVWNGVAAGIQAAAGVMAFTSQQAIQDIDRQIAAEKKKDGQTEASRKKIAQLEAKKAKENEKQQRAAIIANTAVGIMSAIATSGNIYAGLALAAVVAAMGAMQLSALDSGSVADPNAANNVGKLELGSRENIVDVRQGATSGELSYIRGQQGIGGIQDFVPRARGGNNSPRVGYITSEHGAEVVSSSTGGTSVTSTESINESTRLKQATFQLNISAMDAQSFLDRASDLFAAVEAEANAKGFTLSRAN